MNERLVDRQREVVDAAAPQLVRRLVVIEPPAAAVPDKGPPCLCLLATENAGPQPPMFGRVGQLQHHTVVFLCEPLEPHGGIRLAEVA